MPSIRIPTPLRPYAGGQTTVTADGNSVGAVLDDLTRQFPELRTHLFDGEKLRSFVNIYVNKDDIRTLDGPETAVQPDDSLMIVPSIAGGLTW